MGLAREHDLHQRRRRRNALLGATLLGFVVLVFAITMVKLKEGGSLASLDHRFKPSNVREVQQ